jgi:uncharacterized membrane protein
MTRIEGSIDVQVPARTAYNQWTQLEGYPEFMDGVERVTQVDDTHLHSVGEIAGQRREWDTEITEQKPDERIAWKSTGREFTSGVVTFHHLDEGRCRVMLQMEYKPDTPLEKIGDALGVVKAKIKGDLKRFKDYIESRGRETGAWRGEIH